MADSGLLASDASRIVAFMESHLAQMEAFQDSRYPASLREAVSYALFAGGKRLRPALVLMVARMLGSEDTPFLPLAAALEFIHTYSLVHDDLPAMDNDDLRRGKPTCHVRFGEATAILAGDALLTEAFFLAASLPGTGRAHAAVIRYLARAAGLDGMVAGQAADLAAEVTRPDTAGLEFVHRNKTGALLRASVVLPALALEEADDAVDCLARYGEALGMVFQITDDILDEVGDTAILGKPVGSDREQGKTTYATLHGLDGARVLAAEWGDRALETLQRWGSEADPLRRLIMGMLERDR